MTFKFFLEANSDNAETNNSQFASIFISVFNSKSDGLASYYNHANINNVIHDLTAHTKDPFRYIFSEEFANNAGFLDKTGATFIKLGFYLFLAAMKSSYILKDNLETSVQESITDILGKSLFYINTNFAKLVKRFPNLSAFGAMTTFGSSIVFMDVGFALLNNEKFGQQIQEYKRFRNLVLSFINDIIAKCQNTKLNNISRFLVTVFRGLQFTYSKIKGLVSSLRRLISSKNEQVVIQEGLTDSIVGRILKFLLRLTGVSLLIAIAFSFLDDATNGKLTRMIQNYQGPFKDFFHKLMNLYDQTKTKIHQVFAQQQTS